MFELPYAFGEYTLVALIDSSSGSRVYHAIQKGMARSVLVDIYISDNDSNLTEEEFLMNARVRASLNFALVGTVYEASSLDGVAYVTSEFLQGKTLNDLLNSGAKLSIRESISVISALTELCLKFEQLNTAFIPVNLKNIYLDDRGNVKFYNTAIVGNCSQDLLQTQMKMFGEEILPLLPEGQPGSTRLRTLSDWFQHGQNDELLTWTNIHDLLQILREQLGLVPKVTSRQYGLQLDKEVPKNSKKTLLIVLGVLVVCGLATGTYFIGSSKKAVPLSPVVIELPKPDFRRASQTETKIILSETGLNYVGAHEVTIESYATFVKNWQLLSESLRKEYSHQDDENFNKTDRKPKDWDAYYEIARQGGKWKGKTITLRSPVFNVSFWDAYSYARWIPVKVGTPHYRLPTKDEWIEIAEQCKLSGKKDKAITIDQYTVDFDPDINIAGLGSGVREWTLTKEKAPARDLEPPYHVICGGDRDKPGLSDKVDHVKDPNLRDESIGFRIIKESNN